jgi:hypothetical protein
MTTGTAATLRSHAPAETEPRADAATWMLDAAMVGFERGFDATKRRLGPSAEVPAADDHRDAAHGARSDRRCAAARDGPPLTRCDGGRRHLRPLGGGFARYATDAVWLVPHFEKMLYDNAQLARVYLHAWQLTATALREVVEQTLDYVTARCATPRAGRVEPGRRTEGEEGLTYVWDAAEVHELLGADAELFARAYGVREGGNWEGRTILSRVRDDAALAKDEASSE